MNFNKFQKISISFFLVIFLFSIFCLLLSTDRILASGASDSRKGEATNIDITCAKYQYPWCQEAKEGFSVLVGRFYIIALGLVAAAALGVLIYGAILWTVSGAVSTKKDAVEWISGALWGLVLLLGAYLILYTINPDLVRLKDPAELIKPLSSITIPVTPGAYEDAEVRQRLAELSNGKITVNAPEPQTSLRGLQQTTLQGLFLLWRGCGECEIVITGGTETSYHAQGAFSHASGYKLDLRPTEALNQAIFRQIQIGGSCPRVPPPLNTNCFGKDGNIYRFEGTHWDICFQCPRS